MLSLHFQFAGTSKTDVSLDRAIVLAARAYEAVVRNIADISMGVVADGGKISSVGSVAASSRLCKSSTDNVAGKCILREVQANEYGDTKVFYLWDANPGVVM